MAFMAFMCILGILGIHPVSSIQHLVSKHMTIIHNSYLGELRTEAIHTPSGTHLITDAPTDNRGKGEAFSPTDLVATALGSCMVTIMGIAAHTYGFSIDGLTWEVTKIMTDNPRRIGEIVVDLDFHGSEFSDQHKRIVEHITKNCPVALSLHPEVKQTVHIYW